MDIPIVPKSKSVLCNSLFTDFVVAVFVKRLKYTPVVFSQRQKTLGLRFQK